MLDKPYAIMAAEVPFMVLSNFTAGRRDTARERLAASPIILEASLARMVP